MYIWLYNYDKKKVYVNGGNIVYWYSGCMEYIIIM